METHGNHFWSFGHIEKKRGGLIESYFFSVKICVDMCLDVIEITYQSEKQKTTYG
jgi:hypothetical protein